MEITQENSLSSYLYLKLEKMPCFSFYLLCFFFYKTREQKGEIGSAWGEGGTSGREEGSGEMGRRINMVQIKCTHICKYKNDPC
jgi:hypothetical protein